jgi:hypothetical protein
VSYIILAVIGIICTTIEALSEKRVNVEECEKEQIRSRTSTGREQEVKDTESKVKT